MPLLTWSVRNLMQINSAIQQNPVPSATIQLSHSEPRFFDKEKMSFGMSYSLATKFSQPMTFFAIACISISFVAISTAWRDRKIIQHEAFSKPESTNPKINLSGEGYSSPGEEVPRKSCLQESTLFSRTATLVARFSELFAIVKKVEDARGQAFDISPLSAELSLSVSALSEIQQYLWQNPDVLGTQSGLRSCFEMVLVGIASFVSSLEVEMANLCANSVDFARFHRTVRALRKHRESSVFVLDSMQRVSEKDPARSLAPPVVSEGRALTPGADMKGFMDKFAEYEELPEYSPATESPSMATDSKGPPSYAVEIDPNPVLVKAKIDTTNTAAELFAAVREDSISELEALLKAGIDSNTIHGKLQRTALHEAARLNRKACARVLIKHGAIVEVNDSKGDTPLHLASWEGHVEVTLELLSAGADIDRLSGRDGSTPLWCSITAHHIDLARLLLKHGARVSLTSPTDTMPLHQAAITGQSAMCELLLERGAFVDCVDRELNTPLHYAATTGDLRTAKILLKESANVNKSQERGLTPLHWACHKGHDEIVVLLLSHEADVDAKATTFASPLHCAAARGHLGCIKILMKNQVDCSIVTTAWDGVAGTAEEIARKRGFSDVVSVIRSARR